MQMYQASVNLWKLGAWKPCLLFLGSFAAEIAPTRTGMYRWLLLEFSSSDLVMRKSAQIYQRFELTSNRFSGRPNVKTLSPDKWTYQTPNWKWERCAVSHTGANQTLFALQRPSAALCFFSIRVGKHSTRFQAMARKEGAIHTWAGGQGGLTVADETRASHWNILTTRDTNVCIVRLRISVLLFIFVLLPPTICWTFPSSISMLVPLGTGKSILWLGIITAQCNTTANSSRQDRNEQVPI